MKLLFVHGHKFRRVENKIYSPGGLPESVLNRYVEMFGQLVAVGRIIDENEKKDNYSLISNPKIRIVDNTNLKKLVREADAIIIRLPSVNGYKAIHWARKYHKPYLVEVVGCIWDAYWNYGIKGKIVAFPAFMIMKHCVKTATHAVYVSQKFLQTRYPTKGKNVGISDVELLGMQEEVLNNRLNKINAKQEKKIVIGTTAAIDVPHKGQEYIIKALKEIESRTGLQVEYQLVGAGSKNRLETIAKEYGVNDNVEFLGFMNHDQVFEWLDSIDIYIQSSFQEGLCRALVEAMSRGVPCAASAVGGNPELIDNKYVFSMRRKDNISSEIAAAVVELTKSKENMIREAQNNYNHAKNTFERDMLAMKRRDFYLSFKDEVIKCQK